MIIIIVVLKPNSMVDMRQNPSHWSRLGSRVGLILVGVRIKMIIILILKPDSRIDLGRGSSHK
jgi:hypothetical protein